HPRVIGYRSIPACLLSTPPLPGTKLLSGRPIIKLGRARGLTPGGKRVFLRRLALPHSRAPAIEGSLDERFPFPRDVSSGRGHDALPQAQRRLCLQRDL